MDTSPNTSFEVTMVETGEKAEYRWTHLSDDPEVH